ncbi:winged helix DNA-binding protein [Lactobacillus sp.]|uniref:winged helix DNA-binding protein n=1 Tax=Lactobacillus sp. TaxID=1591 RepID=UPI0019BA76C8|nr:winged helix DNA-binding protein [Lactobacillus sp.]MBD5429217.1 winged helix DNA-binding protein [Lactobacillus sp.]
MSIPEKDVYNAIKNIRLTRENPHGTQEQTWIANHVNDCELKGIICKLSVGALHILSDLERESKTGNDLACNLNLTRGGVSRASKKLCDFGLITTSQKNGNKKNIYYTLTDKGREVAEAHDQLHCQMETQMMKEFTEKYSVDELNLISKFLKDVLKFEEKLNTI